MILHTYFADQKVKFSRLNTQLQRHEKGSTHYKELESQIRREYNATMNEEYRQKHRDFNQLHLKMCHIKQLVREYDDVHYKRQIAQSAGSSQSSNYHAHQDRTPNAGDRTDRNRAPSVTSR